MGKRVNTAVWLEKQSRWQIKVQKDGERKTFTSSKPGRTGQREANRKADAWLDDGVHDDNLRMKIIFKEYLAEVKATTSQSNWRQVESIWNNWLSPFYGNKKISAVTEHDLQKPITKASSENLSRKTMQNILNVEKALIKYCRKRKLTSLFPESVTIPKSARYKGKNILQPSDIIKLFNCDNTTNWEKVEFDINVYAYRFQVLTGLRPGELAGLQWNDITGRKVSVRRAKNTFGEITTGKNENAIRSFYLSDMAYEVLQKQKELLPGGSYDYIFGIVSLSGYLKRWKKFCQYNKISPITPYEMRHTFVSIAKNLPDGQVKSYVGHSKNMDTFGWYGHEVEKEAEITADNIEALFNDILHSNN